MNERNEQTPSMPYSHWRNALTTPFNIFGLFPLLVRVCCETIVPQEFPSSLTVAIRSVNSPQIRPKQTLICFSILSCPFEEFLNRNREWSLDSESNQSLPSNRRGIYPIREIPPIRGLIPIKRTHQVGFEPTTNGLEGHCSSTELLVLRCSFFTTTH